MVKELRGEQLCPADGVLSRSPVLGTGIKAQFALFVSKDGEDCKGAEVTCDCELSHVGTGNGTGVLCKSTKCS